MRTFLIGLGGLVMAGMGPIAADAVTFCQLQGGASDALRATNLSSGAPPSEVTLGAGAGPVVLSPDRQHAYVRVNGALKVVDVEHLRAVGTIDWPSTPGPFVAAPDDTLYVVQRTDSAMIVRHIDPRNEAAERDPIGLPSEVGRVLGLSIGDGGRLLYVETSSIDFAHIVYVIELSSGAIISSPIVPADAYFSIGLQASPSADFAYLLQRNTPDSDDANGTAWLIRPDAEPRQLDWGVLDFGDRLGVAVFPPNGPYAYVVRSGAPEVGDRTLLIDTHTHTVVDTLPSGSIAGFDESDCVIVTGGRFPRRACPGDEASTPIAPNRLLPASVVPVGINSFSPTVWTDGNCQAPALPCPAGGACLQVEADDGAPGDTVGVGVRLRSRGRLIAGVQNDLFTDTALPIAATPFGNDGELRATCHVNPEINRNQSAFGCNETTASGCLDMRALIISFVDLGPIADGSLLYTCDVHIPDDTPPGRYRLACGYAGASDGEGVPVPIHCEEAQINVAQHREGTESQNGPASASACQVAPARSGATAWPLALVALLASLRWMRRRV